MEFSIYSCDNDPLAAMWIFKTLAMWDYCGSSKGKYWGWTRCGANWCRIPTSAKISVGNVIPATSKQSWPFKVCVQCADSLRWNYLIDWWRSNGKQTFWHLCENNERNKSAEWHTPFAVFEGPKSPQASNLQRGELVKLWLGQFLCDSMIGGQLRIIQPQFHPALFDIKVEVSVSDRPIIKTGISSSCKEQRTQSLAHTTQCEEIIYSLIWKGVAQPPGPLNLYVFRFSCQFCNLKRNTQDLEKE